jgi:hypothetical protein
MKSPRFVRLELNEWYHTVDSRLSRFGNKTPKTWQKMELKRSAQ